MKSKLILPLPTEVYRPKIRNHFHFSSKYMEMTQGLVYSELICRALHCSAGLLTVVQSLSRVWLFVTPWTVARQAPLSMRFSRQEYWSGLPFPSPGDLPDPVIEPMSPAWQASSLPPARWRQIDPVSRRRRSEWEGKGVTSGEGNFQGEGPACVMTWRCETAPLFQLACVQFHHLRVGSREREKNIDTFSFLSVLGDTPTGLLLALPRARNCPLHSGESPGEKQNWATPSEVWILAHRPLREMPNPAWKWPWGCTSCQTLGCWCLWHSEYKVTGFAKGSSDPKIMVGHTEPGPCQLKIESPTLQETDEQAAQVSLKLDESTFKGPEKRRSQVRPVGMQVPSYQQGTEKLAGKSTVFIKENRNEDIFKKLSLNHIHESLWEPGTLVGMAIHSSILAWRIPWTEEPGGLQSTGSQSRTQLKWLNMHTRG